MNHLDRFDDAMARSPREAAALALDLADRCGSKANAWAWADRATAAAAKAGITLDAGTRSWPETQAMRKQLGV